MSYISHAQLAERPGARELAEVATATHEHIVAAELMEATLQGDDRSAWSADEIAVADDALQRIDDAVSDAQATIDGFLGKRGYLPLNPVPGIVTAWTRAIARYFLHKDRIRTDEKSDPIVRDYRDAMKLLQLTAEGKFSLGADDDLVSQGTGSPEFTPGCSTIRDNLKDF
jgi:phage gp36-like protein